MQSRGQAGSWDCGEWSENTDFNNLPKRVKKKGMDSMSLIAEMASRAAELPHVEKLASDVQISTEEVYQLAAKVDMPVTTFVKKAYADVEGFLSFFKVASGGKVEPHMLKQGGLIKDLIGNMRAKAQGAFAGVKDKAQGAVASALATPESRQTTRRVAAGVGLTTAGGVGAAGLNALANRGGGSAEGVKPDAAQGPNESAVNAMTGGANAVQQGVQAAQTPAPQGSMTGQPGGGMSPAMKALMMGGGAAALGGGAYMMSRRKKKPKETQAMDAHDIAKEVLRKVVVKKAAAQFRREAAQILLSHLDKVASFMPVEKQASVRTVQREIAAGKPLSMAIKLAFPTLSGEQRGILAATMCKNAADARRQQKQAASGCGETSMPMPKGGTVPRREKKEFHGKPAEGLAFMKKEARDFLQGLMGGTAGPAGGAVAGSAAQQLGGAARGAAGAIAGPAAAPAASQAAQLGQTLRARPAGAAGGAARGMVAGGMPAWMGGR